MGASKKRGDDSKEVGGPEGDKLWRHDKTKDRVFL